MFDCPLDLQLFGTADPLQGTRLKDRLQADRLPLDEYRRRENAEKQKNKEALAAQKKARSNKTQARDGTTGFAGGHPGGPTPGPTIEEITAESERFNPRNVEQFVEKFGASDEALASMPMAEQPADLESHLLPFQLQGLKWLVDKESPKLPTIGSQDVVQLWKRNSKDRSLLTNIATNFTVKDHPPLASGGILADDMGLGKTLQIITLIVADRALRKSMGANNTAPTLIISPLTVMSNWTGQIEHHMSKEKPLKVLVHHGSSRIRSAQDVRDIDVVVTTYGTVTTDHFGSKSSKKSSSSASGLASINWRRIVLDEGHEIRNPSSKKAAAVSALNAESRWVLTGTFS